MNDTTALLHALRATVGAAHVLTDGDLSAWEQDWRKRERGRALAVVRPATGYVGQGLVPVTVRFRELSDAEIEAYLQAEQPYDCVGSAKSEGLGIALLSAIESTDPTALVGLPLIATCELLRAAGLDPLGTP